MRYFILLLLAAVAFGADLPPDAVQAVAAYDKACAEAQAKADAAKAEAAKKLLPLLDASMKKATQAGNLDVAMAVKAKREEIEASLPSILGAAHSRSGTAVVEIDSKTFASLGKVASGQTLTISYISGSWGYGGSMGTNTVSPDDESTKDAAKLEILLPDNTKVLVPSGTKKTPFHVTFTSDGEVVLRMKDEDKNGNIGKVKYNVTLK